MFNPKGGVGKTMLATNLAAVLADKGQSVLLVHADTVTGHVSTSLGMDGVATVVDGWRDELDGGPSQSFVEMASGHPCGHARAAALVQPVTEILEPERVASAIAQARRAVDWVIVDLHPSYSPLNRAVFDKADRILVPVTPDLPAIRAVVKLRDVADELGMRDRLSLIINRAGTGVPTADIEQAVGIPAYAEVRSAGPLISGPGEQRGPDAGRAGRPTAGSPRTSRRSPTGSLAGPSRCRRRTARACSGAW